MKRLPPGTQVIVDNKLVKIWRLPNGSVVTQGKRVSADCPLHPDEIAAYTHRGSTVDAIKTIRTLRECSLREALDLLDKARGGSPLNPNVRRQYYTRHTIGR